MKTGNYILFVSSNMTWGGSEVLLTEAAKRFNEFKYPMKLAVFYEIQEIKNAVGLDNYIHLGTLLKRVSIYQRLKRKIFKIQNDNSSVFRSLIVKDPPGLVIISQGNNYDGMKFMKDCVEFSIPYVTLTHLVTENLWPALNDDIIFELRKLYKQAEKNYFVSRKTQDLNEKLLGYSFKNTEIVYNPFTRPREVYPPYPTIQNGIYHVALVGRIEMYHKGLDLLVDILKTEKWRTRPIQFNLYGNGPHIELLSRMLRIHHIQNFLLHKFEPDISRIWSDNHILMMPSRMEGQSLSLIEAMNFKRTAIVTDVGGTTELIDDNENGFVAEYANTESIDAAMERAWEHREQWKSMGEKAALSITAKHPEEGTMAFADRIKKLLRHFAESAG